ncbi:hypothetical protein RU639_001711 [Aspergillus parasiticus]
MSLMQLNTMDLLSADPFSHAEVLDDQHLGDIESLLHGKDLEGEWPATPAPCQILVLGEMPWGKMRLITCRDPSSSSYLLTLPARQAAVGGTSLEIIKRNFILLYCGLPLLEYTSLAAYPRFKETKDTTSSIAFWKAQLKGAMPPVALPWETGLSDTAIAYVS